MIDIHTHILWGLDDGARNLEESLRMLDMAREGGTTAIVATPHANDVFSYDVATVESRIRELSAQRTAPLLYRGCDCHLSLENIEDAFANRRKYTINEGPYLLVEFSDLFIPPNTSEIFRAFLERGMIPVITHPERNPVLQESPDRIEPWMKQGCVIQITAQSLTDRFGRKAQGTAWGLLRSGLVHVIASDAHDTEHRPPGLAEARESITRELGSGVADLLLSGNPGAVVAGGDVCAAPAAPARKKRWFQSWRRAPGLS